MYYIRMYIIRSAKISNVQSCMKLASQAHAREKECQTFERTVTVTVIVDIT